MNHAPRHRESPWKHNTAPGRWYGFGRYYAMFPPSFAYDAIQGLTDTGEWVLDPFCGRGNAPFTATVLGRPSVGIDINPVAWIFAEAKLRPEPDPNQLLKRLSEIARARKDRDRRSRSQFETMAWAPDVRAFLRAARRELDWKGKDSLTDRTLMAFIVLHMQDKNGAGLSNALWPTIACSPSYAVKWWTKNGFHRPPEVEPVALLTDKISRRYRYGIPEHAGGWAVLSDARDTLRKEPEIKAGLLITSPPYNGVTDYWNDHWIRLWALGYRMGKDWKRSAKYKDQKTYRSLIHTVFREARRHLTNDASILVRSDGRRKTAEICVEALQRNWPDSKLFIRISDAPYKGVSAHHGRGGSKARELDILIPGQRGRTWRETREFQPIDQKML